MHRFEVVEKVGDGYGEAVAAAIGMPGDRVFKTLVAEVDGEPVVAVLPVERRLST
ncbi:MAG TPA: Cys-tRNA(Pro) deacylase, partial [Acidimicrobiia bacterium]|nr:Cys-tRNA(Pro) deacylase [Acidimicrobiia bacterium]